MRILIFSDTHTITEPAIRTIERIKDVDMVLHAGDHINDAKKMEKKFPNIEFHYVKGNCDMSIDKNEEIINVMGKKIFLTHGHMYNVKREHGYLSVKYRCEELGCQIGVFGHTHIPYNENSGNLILINPGSVKSTMTYGIIELENDKICSSVCDIL